MNKEKRQNPFNVPTEQNDFLTQIKGNYKGVICPCCNRLAKEQKRKLTPKLCKSLLHILKHYRYTENITELDYFDSTKVFSQNQLLYVDFQKLAYWDLIEAKGRLIKGRFVKDKNMYRISANGIKFAQREIALPLYAVLYNGKVVGHQLNPIGTITDVLNINDEEYSEMISDKTIIQ